MLFNNRIYGLTKGQYSPDLASSARSPSHRRTGTIDYPLSPLSIALGAEATFVARSIDIDIKHLQRDAQARPASTRARRSSRSTRTATSSTTAPSRLHRPTRSASDRTLYLEHGKPMIFGKDRDKGIRLNGHQPEVVTIGENGITEADLLVHDETDPLIAFMLAQHLLARVPGAGRRDPPHRAADPRPDDHRPDRAGDAARGAATSKKLLNAGETWTVE